METVRYLVKWRRNIWEANEDVEKDRQFRELAAEKLIENAGLRREVYENPELFIELFFVIVNKKKQVVPFFLNEVQQDFIDRLNGAKLEFKEGKRAKLAFLVLKGRQQGFTSLITAYQLACSMLQRNFEGFTLADQAENATTIFENKAKYPHSQLPECLKPTEKFNNKKELRFSKLNSSWEVATATKNVGRSRTINFFHGSEAAFWQVAMSDLQAAMLPAMAPDCISIYETTPNGFNDFKDMWDSGVYINCFYEWWRTAEYTQKFESKAHEERFNDLIKNGQEWISERLRWLLEIGLSKEQVYWYLKTYESYIDKEKIKQEYPCTAEEAFLMSGRPVFNADIVIRRIEELKRKYKEKPYKEGYFDFKWKNPEAKDEILDETIKFVESKEKNWIRLYEETCERVPYVLGGDTKGEGSDFYAFTVINNVTGNRAASMDLNLMTSYPFTYQVYCAGKYFNTALVGIEINFNTGPIEELTRLRYPRQYVRRKYDTFTKKQEEKYGWKTDGNTRPLIIDKEAELVLENIDLINDIPTLQQMLTFVYDDNGRPDAISGKHDDLLLSEMIASQIREQQRRTADAERKPRYTADMLEDYRKASPQERAIMIAAWGEP